MHRSKRLAWVAVPAQRYQNTEETHDALTKELTETRKNVTLYLSEEEQLFRFVLYLSLANVVPP